MTSRSARNSRSLTPTKGRNAADPEQLATSNKKNTSSPEDTFTRSLQENLMIVRQSLELYYQLKENGMAQRCIIHNSPVSLYCVNQHKLVCVNCIYTDNKHKSHKMRALDQCTNDLDKDISTASFRVAQKLNNLEQLNNIAQSNMGLMENSRIKLVAKLDQQFDDIVRGLSHKYLELKTAITAYYQELAEQNFEASKQLKASCQTISQALQNLDRSDLQHSANRSGPSPMVFKHLVLHCLSGSFQPAGVLQRKNAQIEHLEIFAEKELIRLKNQITKHRWLKFW